MTLRFPVISLNGMDELIIQMLPAENSAHIPGILGWGIELIRLIQRIENPGLTALLKFITAFGTELFYLPAILFIFWWVDEKRGLRFGILIIVSAWINSFVKDLFKQPRPFHFDASLGLAHESSYGAPSGHAQMSLSFWIPMAAWLGRTGEKTKKWRRLIWAFSIFFILLIGFTRLYLGVHFPTDLFAGWLLGGIILVLWFFPGSYFEKFLIKGGARLQNICAAFFVLVMNGLYPQDNSLPAILLGFCLGYTLMEKRFPFSAHGCINGKKPGVVVMILRCVTGFLGMAVIYLGLRLIFPGEGSLFKDIPVWGRASPFYTLGRFVRYGLVGFWISAGAIKTFQRFGLAQKPNDPALNTNAAGRENKNGEEP